MKRRKRGRKRERMQKLPKRRWEGWVPDPHTIAPASRSYKYRPELVLPSTDPWLRYGIDIFQISHTKPYGWTNQHRAESKTQKTASNYERSLLIYLRVTVCNVGYMRNITKLFSHPALKGWGWNLKFGLRWYQELVRNIYSPHFSPKSKYLDC